MSSAKKPHPRSYARRTPEETLLYRTVQTEWLILQSAMGKVGKSFPLFIKDEFAEFLDCGILEKGFVRTYCYNCRLTGVVAFSCKKRGFCPSCCAKRMNSEAAHLVDQVLPEIPYRQWVLSFPFQWRYQMATNPDLVSKMLKIMLQTISSYQRQQARTKGVLKPVTGGVVFIQRFGSALNLNVHFHVLLPDGVFRKTEEAYDFIYLPSPTKQELSKLLLKMHLRMKKLMDQLIGPEQQFFDDDDTLNEVRVRSIENRVSRIKFARADEDEHNSSSVRLMGLSLNAQVQIPERKRKKLEQLIRYMARGPVASERLNQASPRRLCYEMKKPWKDGTTHIFFSPLEFIAKLAALIPPPRKNLIRYFGCFAPNFKGRDQIVPASREKAKGSGDGPQKLKQERLKWAEMLKRVFKIDVTICPSCSGRMEQIAVIKDRATVKKILESLHLVSTANIDEKTMWERGPPPFSDELEDQSTQDW